MKKISYGGLVSSLVILLLYVGNFTKSKFFFAALCSVFVGLLVEMFGKSAISLIAAIGILSFLIVPNPGYVLVFLALSFYTFFRKRSLITRFAYLNASFFILSMVAVKFFNVSFPNVPPILYVFGIAGLQVAFFIYDYLYNRMINYLISFVKERK
ncbi:hypothetical protein [Thermotoga sp. KOL6]|uniref:hypothetical protein n=1 Tax=Thermotoga sp. KOL6 TaxID=126741 RepID=UPI001E4A5B6B|nr:hypothetical protein [Thermotoga sp. KOL6]